MRIIRIKNIQDVEQTYSGQPIAAGEYFTVTEFDLLRLQENPTLMNHLSANPAKALISDGTGDLPYELGAKWLLGTHTQEVDVAGEKSADSVPLATVVKSYSDSSKSFTSPDFANRQSWYGDTKQVVDEELSSTDNITYSSNRVPTAGWDHDWICWSSIPNHVRQTRPDLRVVVKKNGIVVTTGFTVDYKNGKVIFAAANDVDDIVTVSYFYAESSTFDVTAFAGKVLLVDYIEAQFSVTCVLPINSMLVFEAIYNGPAVPEMGIPANYDVPIRTYEYYGAKDFINESTEAYQVKAFMELTKDVNVLPWNYLTGHTIKPVGDATTDITKGEFNKLRMRIVDTNGGPDPTLTDCEIATGTVYCFIKDLA